ncbi:hypothetical protein F4678DRAFT_479738 [Xylaria arbuscula]|nr:hypothetical protein F4678DRAFT_479738 [Xylaria arbuscula]
MIINSPSQKESRLKAIDLLCSDTLCQSMMMNELANGTGEWIFKRPQYQEWLDMKLGKLQLWISGEPGCGKSYLAKNVVDKLREKDESVICVFLREPGPTIDLRRLMSEILRQALEIEPGLPLQQSLSHSIRSSLINARDQVRAAGSQWNEESHPTENNLHGLLASTIRQVLVEITPESIIDKYLLPLENPLRSLQLDRLQELWPDIMTEALIQCPITVVIDGFDKMKRQDQETFLDILTTFQKRSPVPGRFRLLFLSNVYPALDSDLEKCEFIWYPIDKAEDIGSDIKASVTQRTPLIKKIHGYPDKIREAIEEGVSKAADGMYLRAELILGSLKRTKYDESALNDLLETPQLGAPLQSTAVLYDQILGNIWADSSTRRSIQHVLTWITFQLEGLNPAELGIARALAKARNNTSGSMDYDQVCDLQDDDTELWVNRFLGHLVKRQNDQFELIHPSLMKYLITKPEQLDEEYGDNILPYHAESHMDPAASHALLGNLCATYLARPSFAQSVRAQPGCETWFAWQAAVKERMKEHKFLRYAALHWSEHLRLAQDLAVPGSQSNRIMAADRERHQRLADHPDSWMDVICYFHDWHRDNYPELCSARDKILHRPYILKQSATEEPIQASPTQADMTESGMSDTAQPSLLIEQTTSTIERSIPKIGQSTPRTEPSTPLTQLPSSRAEPPTLQTKRLPLQTEQLTFRIETEQGRQKQGTAAPSADPPRRPHWLVRGAQRVVNTLGLDEGEKPPHRRSKTAPVVGASSRRRR